MAAGTPLLNIAAVSDPFDKEEGVVFTVVYRDAKKLAHAKQIHILKFIRNKQYRLFKDLKGKLDLLLEGAVEGKVELTFVAMPRQRVKGMKFDLAELEPTAVTARGVRISPKAVSKVKVIKKGRK